MKKLTKAQIEMLREASTRTGVQALMQRRRPCERLERRGFLERIGLMSYTITAAGRAALNSALRNT